MKRTTIVLLLSFVIFLAFLVWLMTPGHAQQKTKNALQTEVFTNFPDNVTGAITPAILRTTVIDIINSYLDLNGVASFACTANSFIQTGTTSALNCSTISAVMLVPYSTGYITKVSSAANFSDFAQIGSASVIDLLTGSTTLPFDCTGANTPVINLIDCGNSYACGSPVTMAQTTVTAGAVISVGTVIIPNVTAGDYLAWKTTVTGGDCNNMNFYGNARLHTNG